MNHFDLIADHITPFLLLSLNENIRTTDDSNVKSRTIKIFQDTIQDIDFNNEEIVKLLKDLFIKKSKELKEKAKITVYDDENERKFELLAHCAIEETLDGRLFAEDDEFLNAKIQQDIHRMLVDLIIHYLESFFLKVDFSLIKSWEDAELMAFGKDRPRFTMLELDQLLKNGQGFNAWLNKKAGEKTILENLADEFVKENDKFKADELVDKVKACNWDKEFRDFCMTKYNQK
ncbi:MAG: hypothetical protein WC332_02780 [Clostridia bacterium]|jgi:hypothetical protein